MFISIPVFAVGLLLFLFLNYFSYIRAFDAYIDRRNAPVSFAHDGYKFGFPFHSISVWIGYPSSDDMLIFGMAGNILIAMAGSFVFGWLSMQIGKRLEKYRLHR